MQVGELWPGGLMVAGGFSDLTLHHHPAVQITVGGCGPLTVTRGGDTHDVCRLVVVASGARHAVRSDSESGALTLYLGLQPPQGSALNALTRHGVWIVDDGQKLAEMTAASLDTDGPHAAADFLVDGLCGMGTPRVPQLCRPRRPVRRSRERSSRCTATRPRPGFSIAESRESR